MNEKGAQKIAKLAEADVKAARAPQIRPALRDCIRYIVTEGLTQADAAKAAGMKLNSLQVALRKPHVRAYMAHVKRAWMDSRTFQSWKNVADLADSAMSEDVRLKANLKFLEAAGELGGNGPDPAGAARQLVQILVNAPASTRQLTSDQMPGIIEAKPYQPPMRNVSNSDAVGCDESGDE